MEILDGVLELGGEEGHREGRILGIGLRKLEGSGLCLGLLEYWWWHWRGGLGLGRLFGISLLVNLGCSSSGWAVVLLLPR